MRNKEPLLDAMQKPSKEAALTEMRDCIELLNVLSKAEGRGGWSGGLLRAEGKNHFFSRIK
jgi:hypothetical protein